MTLRHEPLSSSSSARSSSLHPPIGRCVNDASVRQRVLQNADPGEPATARCLTGAHVDALAAAFVGRAGVGGRAYASPSSSSYSLDLPASSSSDSTLPPSPAAAPMSCFNDKTRPTATTTNQPTSPQNIYLRQLKVMTRTQAAGGNTSGGGSEVVRGG